MTMNLWDLPGEAVLAGMVVLPTGYGTAGGAVVTGATLVSHVVGT